MPTLDGSGTTVFDATFVVDTPALLWSASSAGVYSVNIQTNITTVGTGAGEVDLYIALTDAAGYRVLAPATDSSWWVGITRTEDYTGIEAAYFSPFPDPVHELKLYGVVAGDTLTTDVTVDWWVTKLASIA